MSQELLTHDWSWNVSHSFSGVLLNKNTLLYLIENKLVCMSLLPQTKLQKKHEFKLTTFLVLVVDDTVKDVGIL